MLYYTWLLDGTNSTQSDGVSTVKPTVADLRVREQPCPATSRTRVFPVMVESTCELRPTKRSDHYTFGMVMHENLVGRVPFSRYHGYAVVVRIHKGERLGRPEGVEGTWFADDAWNILKRC
ncbi:hypothetical protein BDM02DRAFT_3123764 [Thelephora ganbajun]|uniref:Uncharacterized protein n=1 Tax=Thelephora ganbajun TaxID=370292 RepID=A0ACB6Z0Y9_THEGA|nr:hypothetical protein BDM02DRAFT_3123764 [Thelephora ganbajun]